MVNVLHPLLPHHDAQEDVERLRPAGGATLCVSAEADPAVLRPQTAAEARLYSQLAQGAAKKQQLTEDKATDTAMVSTITHAEQQRCLPGGWVLSSD